MKRILLLAISLTACAPAEPPVAWPTPEPGPCTLGNLYRVLGHRATPAVVERIRRTAGAATARVLRPGQMVTMEYRADRVDVKVDAANHILSLSCG
ncbi:MAG: I78 family peptidase inhibitor [Sphingomonas sp.]